MPQTDLYGNVLAEAPRARQPQIPRARLYYLPPATVAELDRLHLATGELRRDVVISAIHLEWEVYRSLPEDVARRVVGEGSLIPVLEGFAGRVSQAAMPMMADADFFKKMQVEVRRRASGVGAGGSIETPPPAPSGGSMDGVSEGWAWRRSGG